MLSQVSKLSFPILSEALESNHCLPETTLHSVKIEGPEQNSTSPLISNNISISSDFDEYLEQFCNKYVDSYSSRTIAYLKSKVAMIFDSKKKEGYFRQLVAAVIYCEYSDIIRVRIKQFAMMNRLSIKIFNRRYIKYLTILKKQTFNKDKILEAEKQQIKKECKLEDDCQQNQQQQQTYHNRSQRKDEISKKHKIRNAKQAIQLIYDGIFKSEYFQTNRREIIQKMAVRCDQIHPQIFYQLDYTQNHQIKLYYAIYAHFKMIGINISFTKYRQAVGNFVGYRLKNMNSIKTCKLLSNLYKSQQMRHSQIDQNLKYECQSYLY